MGAVKPEMGALQNLALGFLASFFGLNFFTSELSADGVAKVSECFSHLLGIVASVQA